MLLLVLLFKFVRIIDICLVPLGPYLKLYEKEFMQKNAAVRECEIRSTAANRTHVKQPIGGSASKFVSKINPTAEITLDNNKVPSQPWSL